MTKRILPILLLAWVFLLGFVTLSACGATPEPDPAPEVTAEPTMPPTIFSLDSAETASPERLADQRPNIILILTDDQPYFSLDYMPFIKNEFMPASINFQRGFVTTPLCCPSRATMLTGEYVHNHEVYTNEWPMGSALKFDDTFTIGTWLQEIGYRTAYYGKYLNGYNDVEPYGYVPPGWDDWRVMLGRKPEGYGYFFDFTLSENGQEVEYPRKQPNFSADVITGHSLQFIANNTEQPFFLIASYYNPHSPYIAAPRHRETFRAGAGWDWEPHRPPNFNPTDLRDKPNYVQELKQTPPDVLDTANLQILRSLLSVDDGVASIMNILEQTGLDENTIVFFLSDNGMTVGEHGFGVDKNCPYDECIRVPFIVHAPGRYEARTDASLVANIDLVPTFLQLAGYPQTPESVDGLSLIPLFENQATPWRDEILIEHWPAIEGVGALIPQYYGVRTHDWKYVEYETGECELYDLQTDPYELKNLCNKNQHAQIQADLRTRLERLKQE